MKEKKKEMSTAFVKKIIDEACRLGLMHCMFTGGEPLVRRDFVELYSYARKKGIMATIATNGVLIDKKLIRVLKKLPPKCINFSLYGFSRASYARVAGADNYQQAHENLLLLQKNKITTFVKIPVFKFTMREIKQNWDTVKAITGAAPGLIFNLFLRGYQDDVRKDIRIRKLRLSCKEKLELLLLDEGRYREHMRRFCAQFLCPPEDDYLFGCAGAQSHGAVDAYGYLQPCMSSRSPQTRFNLKINSLSDGVKNFFPKVLGMKAKDRRYLQRCKHCVLTNLCESCPGNSFSEYAALDRPVEFLCKAAHYEARYLGILKDNQCGWQAKLNKKQLKNIINGI